MPRAMRCEGYVLSFNFGESGKTEKEAHHSTMNTFSSGHYNHQIMSLLTAANRPFQRLPPRLIDIIPGSTMAYKAMLAVTGRGEV